MVPAVLAGNIALGLLAELLFSGELNSNEARDLAASVNRGKPLKVIKKNGEIKVKPVSPKNNKPYLVKENKKYIPEFKTKMPPKKYAKGGGIKRKPARKAKIAKVMKRKTRKSWLVPAKTVIIQTVNVQGA